MENRFRAYADTVKVEVAKLEAESELLHAKKWDLKRKAVESKKKEFVGAVFYKNNTEDEYESCRTDYEYSKILSVSEHGDFIRVLSIRVLGHDDFRISYNTKSLWNFENWDECSKKEFDTELEKVKTTLGKKK